MMKEHKEEMLKWSLPSPLAVTHNPLTPLCYILWMSVGDELDRLNNNYPFFLSGDVIFLAYTTKTDMLVTRRFNRYPTTNISNYKWTYLAVNQGRSKFVKCLTNRFQKYRQGVNYFKHKH